MRQTYNSIQYLRAVAALMVVGFHLFTTGFVQGAENVGWLRGGVDIFFVISGFIMVKSTDGKQYSPADFYLKRALRIVPIYWVATFVMISSADWSLGFILKSLFFVAAYNPVVEVYQPVLQPGWTLNYEMFFYLVFGLSLLAAEKIRLYVVSAVLITFVLAGLLIQPGGVGAFYTQPILIEFLLGMIIARMKMKLPLWVAPIAFISMPLLWQITTIREIALGLPALLLVASLVSQEKQMPTSRVLGVIGNASYSIYLFHLIALAFASTFVATLFDSEIGKFLFGMSFSTLIGVLAYQFLEKPLTLVLKNRMSGLGRKSGKEMQTDLAS